MEAERSWCRLCTGDLHVPEFCLAPPVPIQASLSMTAGRCKIILRTHRLPEGRSAPLARLEIILCKEWAIYRHGRKLVSDSEFEKEQARKSSGMQKYWKILTYKWDIGTFFLLLLGFVGGMTVQSAHLYWVSVVSGSALAAGGTLVSRSPAFAELRAVASKLVFVHPCSIKRN